MRCKNFTPPLKIHSSIFSKSMMPVGLRPFGTPVVAAPATGVAVAGGGCADGGGRWLMTNFKVNRMSSKQQQ